MADEAKELSGLDLVAHHTGRVIGYGVVLSVAGLAAAWVFALAACLVSVGRWSIGW